MKPQYCLTNQLVMSFLLTTILITLLPLFGFILILQPESKIKIRGSTWMTCEFEVNILLSFSLEPKMNQSKAKQSKAKQSNTKQYNTIKSFGANQTVARSSFSPNANDSSRNERRGR